MADDEVETFELNIRRGKSLIMNYLENSKILTWRMKYEKLLGFLTRREMDSFQPAVLFKFEW